MKRRGFQLAELVIALGIISGPLLIVMHLSQANVAGSHFNQQSFAARMVLVDLSEILMGETLDRLRQISQEGDSRSLDSILTARISRLPAGIRDQYEQGIAPLLGRWRCSLDTEVAGSAQLARLRLEVIVREGTKLELSRLWRPLNGSVGGSRPIESNARAPLADRDSSDPDIRL